MAGKRERSERKPFLCRACRKAFAAESAFDAHRVGSFDYAFAAARPDDRRCLHGSELEELGWSVDSRGCWRRPRHDDGVFSFT
jgi:hypothetical protein